VIRRPVIVASNRGPVSFVLTEDGQMEQRRGGGGLVTALTQALQVSGGIWIASAMSDEDREAGARPFTMEGGAIVRYLAFDRREYDGFYNGISNRVLWYVQHCLWDLPREPQWTSATGRAWEAYRSVNQRFAHALAEEGDRAPAQAGTAYMIQDYHLSLVPSLLRRLRPRARISHFSHIPFAAPASFATLPTAMRRELLAGLLGSDVIGFHTERWAEHFLQSCRDLPRSRVNTSRRTVTWEGRTVRVRVHPISIDPQSLKERSASEQVADRERRIERWLGDCRLLLRVDRTDLSKNILRGLVAYQTFLKTHRRWRRRVKHLALLNPSREGLATYRRYARQCVELADRINRELGDQDWQPIRVRVQDDFETSLAAFGLYDALLVNPVFDGLNLVAKEGPALNRRDGVLILSENAGAIAELGRDAIRINPFDVGETATAIATALEMQPRERAGRAAGLRDSVAANRLDEWVATQLADLDEAAGNA
jgi:trehalose 6-phosphate synthase